MKTQNILENKARFFAQYWGQKIICFPHNKNPTRYDNPNKLLAGTFERNAYLQLKPLSQISDEDLEAISFNFPTGTNEIEFDFQPNNYKFHWKAKKGLIIKEGYLTLKDFDYLRSKGYALPYMDLSVEDLIEYGWIKLKEN